ncbi:MAG: Asp/Glu racemase [Schumannella sp.]|nr:Asp/Glu racemase [Schumannella sp.]
MSGPRVALISATVAAIAPATSELTAALPGVEVWNLLDDRLLSDANGAGGLTPQLDERMRRLIDHAVDGGADGILLTCSLYGPVAVRSSAPIPVLAPDQAAFDELVAGRFAGVLVVASFGAALADSVSRLEQVFRDAGISTAVTGVVVDAAFPLARGTASEDLDEVLIGACLPALTGVDAIFLAQYSLAPAASALAAGTGVQVVSGPASAARLLQRSLT